PDDWVARFHDGEPQVLEEVYRDHFDGVHRAAGRIVSGADRETVVHEVFYRLLSHAPTRQGFRNGSLGAWLAVLARNQALAFLRRYRREVALDDACDAATEPHDEAADARMVVERFRRERLPAKWAAVFEARLVRQLPQREAAQELGLA